MAINKGIDDELFKEIVEGTFKTPYHELLGMELLEIGPGKVSVLMRGEDRLLNNLSIIHGGAIASLCDTAMGMAVKSLGALPITVEMKINFLSPSQKDQDIIATGKVIKKGRTLLVTEAEVKSGGKLIVKAMGTFYNMNEANKSNKLS